MVNTARPAIAHRGQVAISEAPAAPSEAAQLSVKFWGVRGSVPTPTPAHQRYGGNTICVEILIDGQRIIFDGGTGLVGLGHTLSQAAPTQAHLLFTHTQWDRIQGFPFFQPAFTDQNHFSIYGGTAPNGASIKHCLTEQMLKPHFSMPLQNMRAELAFHTLTPQTSFYIRNIKIETFRTNPLTEAMGYRLTWQNQSIVYATDTPTQCVDLDFLKFVDQADILIYDGTYSDLTYLRHNSAIAPTTIDPWELGIEIAQKANVKELVMLHHSPLQDDEALDQLQHDIREHFSKATVAYEGMIITR